jgi:hypothetical protein
MEAQGVAVLVVAAAELDGEVGVSRGRTDGDHAQRPGMPNGVEAALEAQGGIGKDFADGEPWETGLQGGEAGGEGSAFVGVGRMEGSA